MFFDAMPEAPADPILGLTGAFRADPRNPKVNLGVGVFKDDAGRTPVLACVREAEGRLLASEKTKTYAAIDGVEGYGAAVRGLTLGAGFAEGVDAAGRGLATAQAPGGTGALRLGGELLKAFRPGGRVWLPKPTWGNHAAIFKALGLEVREYPYYSEAARGVDGGAMVAVLEGVGAGDAVLFHACCHNPTGADPDAATWARVAETASRKGWLPFFDFAYQGFGDGVEEDRAGMLAVLRAVPEAMVASSFSKNMGLYGERVGALTLCAGSRKAADAGLSQAKRIIRVLHSNACIHGATVAREILRDAGLRGEWLAELDGMRGRIAAMRKALADGLAARCPGMDFGYLARQKGMFSYTGLSAAQVDWLRDERAVYMVKGGRVNVAGLTPETLDYACDCMAEALARGA